MAKWTDGPTRNCSRCGLPLDGVDGRRRSHPSGCPESIKPEKTDLQKAAPSPKPVAASESPRAIPRPLCPLIADGIASPQARRVGGFAVVNTSDHGRKASLAVRVLRVDGPGSGRETVRLDPEATLAVCHLNERRRWEVRLTPQGRALLPSMTGQGATA